MIILHQSLTSLLEFCSRRRLYTLCICRRRYSSGVLCVLKYLGFVSTRRWTASAGRIPGGTKRARCPLFSSQPLISVTLLSVPFWTNLQLISSSKTFDFSRGLPVGSCPLVIFKYSSPFSYDCLPHFVQRWFDTNAMSLDEAYLSWLGIEDKLMQ